MLSLHNIHPLTDFKRNTSIYIDQIRKSLAPLVLTINGKAAVVVQDAGAYQSMVDRLQTLEQEIQELKRVALQRDLDLGLQQLEQGQYSEYTSETLPDLFAEIRSSGLAELGLAE
jgi:PHD/YefM family antitoxin component YafN of YafNO toxin-antitoxin module